MTADPGKVTVRDLWRLRRQGTKIVSLTAYDALTARLLDTGAVHLILVGDSLGMTMLGYRTTIPVTLDQSLHHTAAVVRGVRHAMVIGDMPFLSYHVSPEDALRHAGRYLQEAGADGVKLEGGRHFAPTVARLVRCGIPVLGHIGLLPQQVLVEGGYRVHGKTEAEAASLRDDARALEDAGAFGIVLEGVPAELAGEITESIAIPTIGIGAGPRCSGQIQVTHDLLGLFEEFVPKHTRRYAELAAEIRRVAAAYAADVQAARFPPEESPS